MASRDPDRPNILFILCDDQGPWAMGCAGNPEIRTPNLDRLAASGMRFENFFCTSPVCSPARASILTGRIPSQHGIHDWLRGGNINAEGDKAIEYLAGQSAYSDFLATAGYLCGFSGKWHLGASDKPQKGFSHWYAHARGGGPYYGAPMVRDGKLYREPDYVTYAITDDALSFINRHASDDQPFYLSVHYTAPHSPWDRDNHPAELYDSYDDCPFESCPDVPPHPWQINTAPRGTGEKRRAILKGYFAAVTAMDASIGRILDRLEELGLRENTLVFFCSDNGMNMGHHGIYGKGNGTFPLNMYDTSVKVPAIVSRPGHVPEGLVADQLLSQYDIRPTLLDYLGLEDPEADRLPGRSFAPLLRGEPFEQPESIVVFDEYGPVRMIRTRQWKYVHRYPYGPHELYNLAEDPDEERNLYEETGPGGIVEELKGRLDEWFCRYADPLLDGAREPVSGKGQIERAGPAGMGRKAFETDLWYLDADGRPRRK